MTEHGNCINFTFENRTYSENECAWNNFYNNGWCATKLDEESGDIEKYDTCREESDFLCQTIGKMTLFFRQFTHSVLSECHRNPITQELMEDFSHDDLYVSVSQTQLSFEEAYHHCASFGRMGSVSKRIYDLNNQLSKEESYWIGYKAIENTLYFLEKDSMNANLSEIFEYEFEEDITDFDEIMQNEKCIVGQKNPKMGSYFMPPVFSVKSCSSKFKVLCMKHCPSKW